MNDINVMDHETSIGIILSEEYELDVNSVFNAVKCCMPYDVADHIYPNYPLFVLTIT